MRQPREAWSGRRRAGLWACALVALSALPPALFAPAWVVGMLLPAALGFVVVRRLPVAPLEQAALIALLQVAALLLCMHYVGPLDRLAALGCTLLPPLTWLALRAEPLDVPRGVFLAFCVLLIGSILGSPSILQVLAFVALAVTTLHGDVAASAAEDRASWRGRDAGLLRRAASAVGLSAAAIAAFLVTLQAFRTLPPPVDDGPRGTRTPAAGSPDRSVGLSSDFDFANVPGSLLAMRADRILDVTSADGRPVPSDLYLRCGEFDIPGLDRWGTRTSRDRPLVFDADGVARIGRRLPDIAERILRIEVLEPGVGFAYLAPGTFAIGGGPDLIGDPRAAVYRFAQPPATGTTYGVAFQRVYDDSVDDLPDRRQARLTEITAELRPWLRLFDEILETPRVRREVEPMRVAAAIADEIQGRCRYSLREPGGPHRHSVLNFLDGDREGFCMHFASVTAICLRRAGIPARIGVGLYGGTTDPESFGVRTYGSQHAHAWVEIPFDGLGWVVFDPTPPAARENLRWPDFEVGTEEDAGAEGEAGISSAAARRATLRALENAWPWAAAMVALLLISRLRFGRRGGALRDVRRPTPDARDARRSVERLLKELALSGRPRRLGESLERFATRLGESGVEVDALRDAFAAYQEVRFGGRPFDEARHSRMDVDISEILPVERQLAE